MIVPQQNQQNLDVTSLAKSHEKGRGRRLQTEWPNFDPNLFTLQKIDVE
jgi:hypothetical protein